MLLSTPVPTIGNFFAIESLARLKLNNLRYWVPTCTGTMQIESGFGRTGPVTYLHRKNFNGKFVRLTFSEGKWTPQTCLVWTGFYWVTSTVPWRCPTQVSCYCWLDAIVILLLKLNKNARGRFKRCVALTPIPAQWHLPWLILGHPWRSNDTFRYRAERRRKMQTCKGRESW